MQEFNFFLIIIPETHTRTHTHTCLFIIYFLGYGYFHTGYLFYPILYICNPPPTFVCILPQRADHFCLTACIFESCLWLAMPDWTQTLCWQDRYRICMFTFTKLCTNRKHVRFFFVTFPNFHFAINCIIIIIVVVVVIIIIPLFNQENTPLRYNISSSRGVLAKNDSNNK